MKLLLLLVFGAFSIHAQSSLTERTSTSELIFEEKVISKQSFWDGKHSQIFTKNLIQVSRYLKGNGKDVVELITQGGEIGDIFQEISHGVVFATNQEGIFLCRNFAPSALDNLNHLMLNGSNSFLEFEKNDDLLIIQDYNKAYKSLKNEVYPQIGYTEKDFSNKPVNDLPEIEFNFFNINVTDNSNLEFDVFARCTNQTVRFAGGDIVINYSKEAFNEFIVQNNNVSVSKGEITQNSGYELNLNDFDKETISLNIDANTTSIGNMYLLGGEYANLCHISIKVANWGIIANLGMNSFAMKGNVYYYDRLKGKSPFGKVITAKSIPQLFIPTITSHDTIATAGTGFILNIKGTDFGTSKGDIVFKNADNDGTSVIFTYSEDIKQWTNTLITVRVPSNGFSFLPNSSGLPAGSGKFEVRLPSASGGASLTSPKPLEIKYAVLNHRPGTTNYRAYLGENIETDGNINGILTFRLSQNINNNADAKKSIKDAMCDWSNKTGIRWNIGLVSTKTTAADNDSTNLIYFAPNSGFFGENANATAFTKTSGTRIEPCNSPVRFLREVDIVIRENVVGAPINAAGGYNFNNSALAGKTQMDFYSVIAHELGHTHLLRHALNDSKIMYPYLKVGQSRKIISISDKEGGIDVLDSSYVKLAPFPICAKAINKGIGCLITSTNDKLEIENGITIYPNPFTEIITIKSEVASYQTISLYNSLGQMVSQNDFNEGNEDKTINLSHLPVGIYFVIVSDENKFSSFKLIKK